MPWRVKRELWLYACGFGAIALGLVVAVRDRTIDTQLLGILGVLGGIAILLNNLPANGHDDNS